jgi:hypothetical protein
VAIVPYIPPIPDSQWQVQVLTRHDGAVMVCMAKRLAADTSIKRLVHHPVTWSMEPVWSVQSFVARGA